MASQLDMGRWRPEERAVALGLLDELEERTRGVTDPRWRGLVDLLASATAFVAAMGWGLWVTAELDTDGVVDGKFNSDQPLPIDWALVPTVLYLFGVMWLVFFVMYCMHRYRDRTERSNKVWLARAEHWRHAHGDSGAASEFQAERRARQLHEQFLNQAAVNFTNGWTYSSMFMWTVLLHSFTVTLDLEGDLPSMVEMLVLLHVLCICLALLVYDLPLRCASRAKIFLDRPRLHKVHPLSPPVKLAVCPRITTVIQGQKAGIKGVMWLHKVAEAFGATLAWLLAVHWVELAEVSSAHMFVHERRLHQLKYYTPSILASYP